MKTFLAIVTLLGLFLCFSFNSRTHTEGRVQLIVFEGSDWCSNCKRLEKHIFSDTAFIQFLNTNHIEIQKIDFPQRTKLSAQQSKYNSEIAEKYGFKGVFPTLVLSQSDTFIYENIDYQNESVVEFEKIILQKLKLIK